MNKKVCFGLFFALLFVNMLTLVCMVKTVKADETIYILADGDIFPSTAPIQRNGNIYTFTDNIFNSVVVNRSNIIVDGKGFTLNNSGLKLYYVNNVTIQNINIRNSNDSGISLYSSCFNRISQNNITDNKSYGIHLDYHCLSNIISENIIKNNGHGVYIEWGSDNNTISENSIINNKEYGLKLVLASNCVLRNNVIIGNRYNFGVFYSFVHDVDESNSVDGKPIYYLVNRQNIRVPSNAGYVALVNSANITVEGLELQNNGQGIVLINTTHSKITNNIVKKKSTGCLA